MDLEAVDNAQPEPPETPAPVFAARAIKHAIFGTPAPPDTVRPARTEPKPDPPAFSRPLPADFGLKNVVDPDKPRLPGGILSTPGTVKDRKTVSFGAQVVDNEGKKPTTATRTGLPSNCPGKFPSPFTPKVDGLAEEPEERSSSSSKLTAKLYEARNPSKRTEPSTQPLAQPSLRPKPRAKDDGDVTLDVLEPRSESGRYWKEQYEMFAVENEREARKIIRKYLAVKEYARKKDIEVLELTEKLDAERKRHAQREKDLEAKNKDYKERLRQAMAEHLKSTTENATLRQRLAVLEGEAVPDSPADQSMPKTELGLEFDRVMLDPQEARHYTLDATPVNDRNRPEKPKAKTGSSTTEQKPLPKATLLPPSREPQSRLGVSPRRPRRSTAGNRTDMPATSRANAKTASTSAAEDPWMANGDTAIEDNTSSAGKRREPKAAKSAEPHGASHPRRVKSDRHLQSLANPSVSAPEGLTPQEMRKKQAMDRIMQKKREREMGKENAGV
ncbi:spindle-body formation-associated protein [Diplodia corticola]|uniref:Spindle-body formation-associated protein n=1 Tax=Diplodia corticola TaxID=236234 RepID=A0A1J9RVU1_9PEZI|nr:spindle-body formation-associated protein [Diplodia corticola]OJD31605.1 spindle-body formation-associated protein [Diplodia corticola]